MPTVTFGSTTYECAVALKGDNYIHLLDANDNLITTFGGITNFDAFSILDGDWTTPTPVDENHIAVMGEDGCIRKSTRSLAQVPSITVGSTAPAEVTGLSEGDIYIYIPS